MRSPGFPPEYIFDEVNLELAAREYAPLEDRTKHIESNDATAIQKK